MSPRSLRTAGIFIDEETSTAARIMFDTPEWEASLEWLKFHDVDPKLIPAGTEVVRDAVMRCIHYTRIVLDDQGRKRFHPPGDPRFAELVTTPAIEQGEAPPLPYPDVITALLQPVRRPTTETT